AGRLERLLDRRGDAVVARAEPAVVRPARGEQQHAGRHLGGELDGPLREPLRVRDEDERDARPRPDRPGAHAVAASRAASSRIAVDVAPGSWWPALRSPR